MTRTSKLAKIRLPAARTSIAVATSLPSLAPDDRFCCCTRHRLQVWSVHLVRIFGSSATKRAAMDGSSSCLWPCLLR